MRFRRIERCGEECPAERASEPCENPRGHGGAAKGPRALPVRSAVLPGEVERTAEDEARDDDLALLLVLVSRLAKESETYEGESLPADDEFGGEDEVRERVERELGAFSDMLMWISERPGRVLSEKQRVWAFGAAERLDLEWGEPGRRNRSVPRGAEVSLLVDAMPRPLAPPGRRKAS